MEGSNHPQRVGIAYDEIMLQHKLPPTEEWHERPERISSILQKLKESGLYAKCVPCQGASISFSDLLTVHQKKYAKLISSLEGKEISEIQKIAAKYDSVYLSEGSSKAAAIAAGSLLEVSRRVAIGELNSGFAIIRPPGHHAKSNKAMGFCLYNNIAISAKYIISHECGINKILIVDWDIHHGNGTQESFWEDSNVLYFSVHRYGEGAFYPSTGTHKTVGAGTGLGYTINVPWPNVDYSDSDYIAVWRHILLLVATQFQLDMILIFADFDAALNDPIGQCSVSPYGFSVMLHMLMRYAQGKIVLTLEGGYNLKSIPDSVHACVYALLEKKIVNGNFTIKPLRAATRDVINMVRRKLSEFWPALDQNLPRVLLPS